MVVGVNAVYRITTELLLTPCFFCVMLGGPQGWGFTGQVQVSVTLTSSGQRAHGQRVLLINRFQLFSAHSMSDELKLLRECLAAVCHADVWDVCAANIIAQRTLLGIKGAKPVAFGLKLEEAT